MSKMIKTTYYHTNLLDGDMVETHSYTTPWEPTTVTCPRCKSIQVWCESGEGDYYDGPKYMCTECGSWFYYKGYELINEDPYDVNYQTLQQLRDNNG